MRDPDELRARAGVRGDPDADQHFLVDDRVLDRLPEYAPANAFGHVLEVGAGTGALTDRLLARSETVTAIERDPDLVAFLQREFSDAVDAGRLTVIGGDACAVDLPEFTASISNLPYGASSEILFRLLPRKRPLVVTVQREFAERMAADPGTSAYGRLSVTAQHYAAIELVEPIPPEAFDPKPRVESHVVSTTPRDPEYVVEDEAFFLDFVKAVFTQRRKTLRNAIRNTTHISGIGDAAAVLDALDADLLDRRPGTIEAATFARIARVARKRGEPAEARSET
jgi:16S rRNA (adenine1518-N6/adenine1519-N6)-dimethyltransferase